MKRLMTSMLGRTTVIIVLISLFSASCSSRNIVSWFPFWSDDKEQAIIKNKDVEQFVSEVRPSRWNPGAHYLLARYYQERGRHHEAILEFRKAIIIDPSYIKAYNGLGTSYDLLEEYDKAIEAYETALSLNPDQDFVHNNLGYSYLLQGNLDAAITSFQKALALDGQKSLYHNNLGIAYAKKGMFDKALDEFKRAGDESMAYYRIARFYYQNALYNDAVNHYSKALMLDPSNSNARHELSAAESMARINQKSLEQAQKDTDMKNATAVAMDDGKSSRSTYRQNDSTVNGNITARASVEISNGNGVNRMAKRVGEYLTGYGYEVARLTNADSFNYAETKIYYRKGYLQEAYRLAQHIPGYQNMEKVNSFGHQNINIKVLIGRDIVPFNRRLIGRYEQS